MSKYRIYKLLLILTLMFLICIDEAISGVTDDMKKFFDGGGRNFTESEFVKGQKAGHLSLGGYSSRYRVSNTQLASMQLPSYKAGCGGIDFHAGGFSFIKSSELSKLIQNIGQNATGLMTQMGIEMLSPKISGLIKYFNQIQKDINALNINSCNAARAALKHAAPYAKEAGCKVARVFQNLSNDEAAARASCTSGKQATETLNSAPEAIKAKYKLDDVNIAWKTIKESGLANVSGSFNQEVAEYLMALSGTIILKGGSNDESEGGVDYFAAKMRKADVVNVLLNGGDLKIHTCDETNLCLNLSKDAKTHKIAKEDAYINKVKKLVDNVVRQIENERNGGKESLSDSDKKFLNNSSLPIYRMLNIHVSYYANSINMDYVSEYMALEMLYEYFRDINLNMRIALGQHRNKYDQTKLKSFFAEQEEIKEGIEELKQKLDSKVSNYQSMIARTEIIEEMLHQEIFKKVSGGAK